MKELEKGVRFRIRLIGVVFTLCFALVAMRAFDLQVLQEQQWEERAERQHQKVIPLTPQRGTIFDRNGEELAVSVDVDSVYAEPGKIKAVAGATKSLAKVLGISTRSLKAKLKGSRNFVWLKRQITPGQSNQIKQMKLEGVGMIKEHRRFYPNSTIAGHLLGFTGHKSLCGPMGTGGLIVGERVDEGRLRPLKRGGTGSHSEHEEQPAFLPDSCESGTPNAVGLAGLQAGIRWVLDRGVPEIRAHEEALTQRLIDGLAGIPGVTVFGGLEAILQTATVAFDVGGLAPSEVGLRLDEEYGIMCRVGLHCSPAAHKTIGTFPVGTVRFGLGAFNTAQEVDSALAAIEALAREGR